jgi:hypothetical protein
MMSDGQLSVFRLEHQKIESQPLFWKETKKMSPPAADTTFLPPK